MSAADTDSLGKNVVFKEGAGVLPYCVKDGQLLFLLHSTSVGKKVGFLIDFGGALEAGETSWQGAIRELNEETLGQLWPVDYLSEKPQETDLQGSSKETEVDEAGGEEQRESVERGVARWGGASVGPSLREERYQYRLYVQGVQWCPPARLARPYAGQPRPRAFHWLPPAALSRSPIFPRVAHMPGLQDTLTRLLTQLTQHGWLHPDNDVAERH